MTDKPKKPTLAESDIKSARGIGRRAFLLGTLGGTTALAACVPTGVTDADTGAYADPVGAGRGGGRPYTGVTDSDGGAYADPAGAGRGRRSCTDSDGGYYADPVGRGRRC
ncbi:hypothetical protein N8I71_01870 [Roseibacterium sp. SDUM158016]|jgi:hypothetical protein|uniref:hypothetical protein n=1 Tax=Roseicyclus sediminis TaxID=2980997 RepID=UPI0021CE1DC3|nr:hypothetical protein [Roseibacterium sp. SDUM158016]MCU4651559.1 hypothetical protein [Roseibacterium sp. SDUM158016]